MQGGWIYLTLNFETRILTSENHLNKSWYLTVVYPMVVVEANPGKIKRKPNLSYDAKVILEVGLVVRKRQNFLPLYIIFIMFSSNERALLTCSNNSKTKVGSTGYSMIVLESPWTRGHCHTLIGSSGQWFTSPIPTSSLYCEKAVGFTFTFISFLFCSCNN